MLTFSLAAQASMALPLSNSLKTHPFAREGCSNLLTVQNATNMIRRFNLPIPATATVAEKQKLGSVLLWIQALNGGTPPAMAMSNGAYGFRYLNGIGNSAQRPGFILIRRGLFSYGLNAAQIAHEFAHYIGNRGAYALYRRAVGNEMCKITMYSDNNWNEQFAEVFAAFVTTPSVLKNNGSRACNNAWLFFKNDFFERGSLAESCNR
jgi:hypothetical protein